MIGPSLSIAGGRGSAWTIANTNPKLWMRADYGVGTTGAREFTAANSESFLLGAKPNPGTDSFWVSYWCFPTAVGATTYYCGFYTGGQTTDASGFLVARYGANPHVRFNTAAGGATITQTFSDISLPINSWSHVVAVFNRIAGTVTVYKNGVPSATVLSIAAKTDACTPTGAAASAIGSISNNWYEYGRLSRVAYGTGLLTSDDIAELYNQGNGKFYAEISPTLAAKVTHYWNLNEAAGNAIDAKGTNDGTDTNTVTAAAGPREATASDTVGGYHGVLTNMDTINAWSTDVPTALAGSGGYSLTFDGTDDCLVIGNVGNVTAIEFYVKSLAANQELMTLANSTATAVTVVGGTLTFGALLAASAITVDGVSKSAAEAGALINDGTWHKIAFTLTSVAASNLKLATDSSAFGNIRLDDVKINGGTSYWPMDDGPQGGEPSDGDPISTWESAEGSRYQFNQATAASRPAYVASAINNRPALDFDGTDDYLSTLAAVLSGTAGHVFAVVKADAATATVISHSDVDTTTSKYIRLSISAGDKLLYDQRESDTADTIVGDTTIGTAAHVLEWVSNGTAFSGKVDGTAQTLTVSSGANNGDWFGDLTSQDTMALGVQKTASMLYYLNGKIAEIVAFDAAITDAVATRVRAALASKYGITLA